VIHWILSSNTVLCPDIVVVCGSELAKHTEETPALIVEILSAGTREQDLSDKHVV